MPLRTAVLIVAMPNEVEVAKLCIQSLLPQLESDDGVYVFLHSGSDSGLENFCAKYDRIKYFQSDKKYGVASSRNFLFSKIGRNAFDAIALLDSDTILPSDYLGRIKDFYARMEKPGIVGPVVLDYPEVCKRLERFKQPALLQDLEADRKLPASTEIKKAIQSKFRHEFVDHAGMVADYDFAYFNMEFISAAITETVFPSFNNQKISSVKLQANFHQLFFDAAHTEIVVSNIPGCCQFFGIGLLEEIGELDELFDPYGFEDSDFAIRAQKAGYNNYVDTENVLLHRTDQRHSKRVASDQRHAFSVLKYRAFAHLYAKHHWEQFPNLYLKRVLYEDLRFSLTDKPTGTVEKLTAIKQACQRIYLQDREKYVTRISGLPLHEQRFMAAMVHALPGLKANEDIERLAREVFTENSEASGRKYPARVNLEIYEEKSVLLDQDQNTGGFKTGKYAASQQEKISEKDRHRLESLRDRFSSHRCFIIGNGPSLNKTDLWKLRNEYTFGVNGVYLLEQIANFRPTFYAVEDNHVVDDNLPEIRALDCKYKFFPNKYREAVGERENHFFLPVNWEFYYKSSKYFCEPRFSFDISKTAYVGQTVTYLNFQIAKFLGFKDIILIGVDFDYKVPKDSKIKANSILSNEDDPNHFHPNYFGRGKKWHLPKLENCYKAYQHANKVAKENGFVIRDATIGGKLDAFPKVQYKELFERDCSSERPNAAVKVLTRHIIGQALQEKVGLHLHCADLVPDYVEDIEYSVNSFQDLDECKLESGEGYKVGGTDSRQRVVRFVADLADIGLRGADAVCVPLSKDPDVASQSVEDLRSLQDPQEADLVVYPGIAVFSKRGYWPFGGLSGLPTDPDKICASDLMTLNGPSAWLFAAKPRSLNMLVACLTFPSAAGTVANPLESNEGGVPSGDLVKHLVKYERAFFFRRDYIFFPC